MPLYGSITSFNIYITIGLLIFLLSLFTYAIHNLKYQKYVRDILIMSLSVLFWEILIEPLGWYFKLWDFMSFESKVSNVIYSAIATGFFFYFIAINIAIVLIYLNEHQYSKYIPFVLLSLMIIGYIMDILGGFRTYFITLLVWSFGMLLFYFSIRRVYCNSSSKIQMTQYYGFKTYFFD